MFRFYPFTVMHSFHVGIITEILMSVNINEHYLNLGSHPYFTYFIPLHSSKIGYFFYVSFFQNEESETQLGQVPGHHSK